MKKYDTPGQATDGNMKLRMRFACWIAKATNTNSEYLIFLACAQQQWSRERASLLLLYVHCLLVNILKPSSNCTQTFLQYYKIHYPQSACLYFVLFLQQTLPSFPRTIH